LLEAAGLGDRLWIIGGNLPAQDHESLRALGFKGVFQTGSRLDAICDFIKANRS
jgi:methylmalonyl-CoA mutase C-terminal domain/subunit